MANKQLDPFTLHRLALAPFRHGSTSGDISDVIKQISAIPQFTDFLEINGLMPLWCDQLTKLGLIATLSPDFATRLHKSRIVAAAHYLQQTAVLQQLHKIFEAAGIQYAVFKGCQVREQVYDTPSDRQACDIDVLITYEQRLIAARVLAQTGFKLSANRRNIGHEVSFHLHGVDIDLHWDILRTGRTARPLTTSLLAMRSEIADFWGLDDTATAFVLLVHSTFSKYVNSRNALLIRLLDLQRLLDQQPVSMERLQELLSQARLHTAAWATLYWASHMLNWPVPQHIQAILKQHKIRQRFLRLWIEQGWSDSMRNNPAVIHSYLTLMLHDRSIDAFKTAIRFALAKYSVENELATIQDACK